MKKLISIHSFLVVGLSVALCTQGMSQTAPTLGVQLNASVSVTGTNSELYAIQSASNPAGSWACVGLLSLPATNLVWTDTNQSAASGQRFYRLVAGATNLAWILPGTFTIGSPTNEALRGTDEVQHIVNISRGFYMGKYPVTQAEYLTTVGSNPSSHTGNLAFPVEEITWYDATNYCGLRTAQERAAGLIPTNWVYRLPTESEWEYAARAGSVTAFYLGSTITNNQANFNGQLEYDAAAGTINYPSGTWLNHTTRVGNYGANGWGLYDMAGNVWQWCQDWYGAYPTQAMTDPQGPASGAFRIIRGGSCLDGGFYCRSAERNGMNHPNWQFTNLGLRVVLAQQ